MNAKKELLKILGPLKMKCAKIHFGYPYYGETNYIILKINYSEFDLEEFLNKLNVEYDDGYGGQELYGTVWLEDNTWLDRGEYDGSEWWNHYELPAIPEECK